MKTHPNELLILYHADSEKGKKTLAYAYTLTPFVRGVTFDKALMTTTMWRQLLQKLDLLPKHLLDKSHPYYQAELRGRQFDDEDWLNVLKRNHHLIKAPIAIKGKRAKLCNSPTEIFTLLQEVGAIQTAPVIEP